MANFNDGLFGSFTVANKIGTSLERLRYWENLGILKPNYVQCGTRQFKRYSQEDINKAILVKKLVDEEKYSLGGAIMKLKEKLQSTEKSQDEEKNFILKE
ncbi:MAG: MerR family transcriptional regulator [Candidatus Omnitrophica bacterium]|nr:MerR family transcriptional regulator [Candidatus Omnitrophota bacterium]